MEIFSNEKLHHRSWNQLKGITSSVWETGHLILNQSETFESLASLNTQWVVSLWQITGKTFEKKKEWKEKQKPWIPWSSLTTVLCPGWCHQRPWNGMSSTWWISHSLDLNVSSKWACERQSWTILLTQDCKDWKLPWLKGAICKFSLNQVVVTVTRQELQPSLSSNKRSNTSSEQVCLQDGLEACQSERMSWS